MQRGLRRVALPSGGSGDSRWADYGCGASYVGGCGASHVRGWWRVRFRRRRSRGAPSRAPSNGSRSSGPDNAYVGTPPGPLPVPGTMEDAADGDSMAAMPLSKSGARALAREEGDDYTAELPLAGEDTSPRGVSFFEHGWLEHGPLQHSRSEALVILSEGLRLSSAVAWYGLDFQLLFTPLSLRYHGTLTTIIINLRVFAGIGRKGSGLPSN